MSIIKSIDDFLLNKQAERATRERSGCFSPSLLGRCYRAQFWNRKNEPQTNPPDINALRRFYCGNLFHDFVQSMLPPHQNEVKVAVDPDILGFADIVGDNFVADLKSQHSRAFWYMLKPEYNIEVEKLPNILQVVYYASRLGKPIAKIVWISKDDLCIEERDFVVETWLPKLEEELEVLRSFWALDVLPEPKPRAYGGKEGQYCGWCDKCMSMGFDCKKVKQTKEE